MKKLRDLVPILAEAEARTEPRKIPKEVVVYEPPKMNRRDFTCGGCVFFQRDASGCAILYPSAVGEDAGCNLWVGGETTTTADSPARELVPQVVAGYMTDGPFTCGRCEYFKKLKPTGEGACAKVEGPVHEKGCCNHWEGGAT